MRLPHEQTSGTHLTVLIRAFIDPLLKLSGFLVTSVLVFSSGGGDVDLGMKLVSAALRVIVVVKARVAIIVQLTDLWKSKKQISNKTGAPHLFEFKIIKLIQPDYISAIVRNSIKNSRTES